MTEYEELIQFLDKYDIFYRTGYSYTEENRIDGFWIEIPHEDINFEKDGTRLP